VILNQSRLGFEDPRNRNTVKEGQFPNGQAEESVWVSLPKQNKTKKKEEEGK
jgi:hypothetical protein